LVHDNQAISLRLDPTLSRELQLMDNSRLFDAHAPFMARLQDTDARAVVMVQLRGLKCNSWFSCDDLIESIKSSIPETEVHPNRCEGRQPREIAKLEARWLPRRGYESEGYPPTILVDEQNVKNV
jgi:hypothetical protein